jgi:nitrogen-specific signal transduction histidine kinase
VSVVRRPEEPALPPPFDPLRTRLLSLAAAMEAGGMPETAAELRREVETWWAGQQAWNEQLMSLLAVHHEINNALVGVRGNAQLVMLGPGGQLPGVRDRMEVVIRESERIQQLAARLRQLKAALGRPDESSRAA